MKPSWPSGADDERLLVVLALDVEALGQAAAPRPLLADGPDARARRDVVELLERVEGVGATTNREPTTTSSSGNAISARW